MKTLCEHVINSLGSVHMVMGIEFQIPIQGKEVSITAIKKSNRT